MSESGFHLFLPDEIRGYYNTYSDEMEEMCETFLSAVKSQKEQFVELDGYDPEIPIVCSLRIDVPYYEILWEDTI